MDFEDTEALKKFISRFPELTIEQITGINELVSDCVPIAAKYRLMKRANSKAADNYLVVILSTLLRTVSNNVDEALTTTQRVREALIFIEKNLDREKWTN